MRFQRDLLINPLLVYNPYAYFNKIELCRDNIVTLKMYQKAKRPSEASEKNTSKKLSNGNYLHQSIKAKTYHETVYGFFRVLFV